jgi:hypothetical protein
VDENIPVRAVEKLRESDVEITSIKISQIRTMEPIRDLKCKQANQLVGLDTKGSPEWRYE